MFDSVLTSTLADTPDNGTTLAMVQEKLDMWQAMPSVVDQVGWGWGPVLDELAGVFGAASVASGEDGT